MSDSYEPRQGETVDPKRLSRKRQLRVKDKNLNDGVLRGLLGSVDGRRWIWNQLGKMNVFSQTVDFSPAGHAVMAYAEGRRSLGLELLADVTRLAPEAYVLMTRENSAVELEIEENGRSTDDPDA